MEWNTFIASVATSTTIIAVMGYIFKRLFDKSFDVLAEKIKETTKARVQEASRREAALYDERLELVKQCTSIAYRLRNSIRDLSSYGKDIFNVAPEQSVDHIQKQYRILEELLYDSRAILPRDIFEQAHELKCNVLPLVKAWEKGQGIRSGFRKHTPVYRAENRYEVEEEKRDNNMYSVTEELSASISNCYHVVEPLYASLLREANLFITNSK